MRAGGSTKSTQSGGHRGLGHAGESSAVYWSCAKVTPPAALMACMPTDPSDARAGQDDADGAAAALLSQRAQEAIDGHVGSRPLRAGGQPERALCDGEIDIRRNDIDVVGFHGHQVDRLADRHEWWSEREFR